MANPKKNKKKKKKQQDECCRVCGGEGTASDPLLRGCDCVEPAHGGCLAAKCVVCERKREIASWKGALDLGLALEATGNVSGANGTYGAALRQVKRPSSREGAELSMAYARTHAARPCSRRRCADPWCGRGVRPPREKVDDFQRAVDEALAFVEGGGGGGKSHHQKKKNEDLAARVCGFAARHHPVPQAAARAAAFAASALKVGSVDRASALVDVGDVLAADPTVFMSASASWAKMTHDQRRWAHDKSLAALETAVQSLHELTYQNGLRRVRGKNNNAAQQQQQQKKKNPLVVVSPEDRRQRRDDQDDDQGGEYSSDDDDDDDDQVLDDDDQVLDDDDDDSEVLGGGQSDHPGLSSSRSKKKKKKKASKAEREVRETKRRVAEMEERKKNAVLAHALRGLGYARGARADFDGARGALLEALDVVETAFKAGERWPYDSLSPKELKETLETTLRNHDLRQKQRERAARLHQLCEARGGIPRFGVGDLVQVRSPCDCGSYYHVGVVVMLWPSTKETKPYRVVLDDGRDVFPRVDADAFVRRHERVDLRFTRGDQVQAHVDGGYQAGKVVRLNYVRVDDFDAHKVFPYQIHLHQDPEDVHVYAPEDDDLFVRRPDDEHDSDGRPPAAKTTNDRKTMKTKKTTTTTQKFCPPTRQDERQDDALLSLWRRIPAVGEKNEPLRLGGGESTLDKDVDVPRRRRRTRVIADEQ